MLLASQIVEQGQWRSASATWDFDADQRIVGPPPESPVEESR
jgi:hypothetical protein